MAINIGEFRSKIYSKYRSQSEFSKDIGWNTNKTSRILNGSSVPDIDDCAEVLNVIPMTAEEYCKIFLPNVSPFGEINATPKKTS